uniref:Arylacetamide deacetylase-like 3 n=1 Tax=Pogona vitticeps TaxID=103695 RepID=A0A6J0UBT7_9SAUR
MLGLRGRFFVTRFLMALLNPKIHPSLSVKDLDFSGVPVKVYQPKAPPTSRRKGFVYFHGGAGVVGTTKYYQDICSRLAKGSESVLVAVGYRLSPEHPYPTQQKDCYTATVHFMQHAENYGVDPSQIIIGGDSAGGNFAAAVAQKLVGRSDLPKLRAQVLIYAGLQAMDFNLPSYQQNATFPLLYRHNVVYYGLHYLGKDISLRDDVLKGSHVPEALRLKYGKWVNPDNIPERFKRRGYEQVPLGPFKAEVYKELSDILEFSFSPLFAEDSVIQQLPETLIVSCEYDVFRDDSLLYKKRLEDNGVKVSWFHAKNGFHGVINFFDFLFFTFPTGLQILDHIAEFIKHL